MLAGLVGRVLVAGPSLIMMMLAQHALYQPVLPPPHTTSLVDWCRMLLSCPSLYRTLTLVHKAEGDLNIRAG